MPNVLVVEDEHVLRLTFEEFLGEEGYDVVGVENFEQAIARLEEMDFDVIVSDIILGGKTGIDLLRTVEKRGIDAMVIMVTGDPSVETASQAVRLGAFDYLAKPVTGPALKNVVRLALDRKQLSDERDRYRRDLDLIFNSVNEGIVSVDEGMHIVQMNNTAREIFGLGEDTGVAGHFNNIFPQNVQPIRDALENALASRKETVDLRVELPRSNSSRKILILNICPLTRGEANHEGALLVVRDITRLTQLEKQAGGPSYFRRIIGKSAQMRAVFQMTEAVAETDSTVLICGESGTGKELVANALHEASPRANTPLVKVNCAALPEDVLESELFGHVKGAFTGALKDRKGRFESANGGTIFLDEIGDISSRLQIRLLRILQEREFERVGESKPIHVDIRIITATNQDLIKKINDGSFRQDLYYRLNVVRIEVPPLREHKDDIPLLVDHFCRQFNSAFKKEITGPTKETLDILMNYPWLGNVRELENCMERAFVVCHDTAILPEHLPPEILDGKATIPYPELGGSVGHERVDLTPERILDALTQTDWNVAKGARKLGIARNTLYQKMKAFGLSRPT